MRQLILASQSPRRHEILQNAGFKFRIISLKISEILKENMKLGDAVADLARQKAEALVNSDKLLNFKEYLVIAADTVVVLENRTLGKPKSKFEARETLGLLSGKVHKVITGICLWDSVTKKKVLANEQTVVEFNSLSEVEITNYVETKNPFDKAGSYGIQEVPAHFIKKIVGPRDNVVGFPLDLFKKKLGENNWVV